MTPTFDTMEAADQLEHRDAACKTCGKAFRACGVRNPFDASNIMAWQLHCDQCTDAEHERITTREASRRADQAQAAIEEEWAKICPENYRSKLEGGPTSIERLAEIQPKMESILSHPYGPQGLILRGSTGTGKTRCMFRLLRSYFVSSPRPKIIAMSSGQFDRQARDAAGNFTLSRWFDRLEECDALFIDDIGKGKWTAATAGHFWEIVDARTKRGRPIFLTTNCNGDTLVESIGLSKDVAEPLLRRLRELCRTMVVQSKPTQ